MAFTFSVALSKLSAKAVCLRASGAIVLALLVGCATSPQRMDPDKVYRLDMVVEVNRQLGEGMLVVPRAPTYRIKVESRGKIDLFMLRSRAREEEIKAQKKDGLFGSKRKIEFDYTPNDIEDSAITLTAYQKAEGYYSRAFIDFTSVLFTLPAKVLCNGLLIDSDGVSVCQSARGLAARIVFTEPVAFSPSEACPLETKSPATEIDFKLTNDKCVYAFVAVANPDKIHKLTTHGYDGLFIRED